jgi:DNA ligase (NAD+)
MSDLISILDKIDACDNAYYNESKSLLSDAEYDALKDNLRKNGDKFTIPAGKEGQALRARMFDALNRVGAPIPIDGKWPKVTHEVPMGSLNKVNTPEELKGWWDQCGQGEILVTHKMDGISIDLKYDTGRLVQAATRGDGETGENITRNVTKMGGVPVSLRNNFSGHIRGEIVMLKSVFDANFKDTMSNVRNAASGIAKRFEGDAAKYLTVVVYAMDSSTPKTESELFDTLKGMGFTTPWYQLCKTDKEASKVWQEYMDSERAKLDYEIDGLVIRINNLARQFALGDSNHRPKGAIAFKFLALGAQTPINDIVCQVGDTGVITPVAEFDEVELVGAKIRRASLHNFSNIKTLGIDIGAVVLIERANDVIPFCKEVVKGTGTLFQPPKVCPACGTKTHFKGEYLVCPNKLECPPQVIGRLNKWIKELGILEWGEKVLQKLIDANLVRDVADLYILKAEDIESLDRMGSKSAENLIAELDKFRQIPLENFIGGLSIDGVATSSVKMVMAAGYDSLESIRKLSVNQLSNIPGFGTTKAQSFHQGLIENKDRIQAILDAGVTIKARAKGTLTGKSFCFTGSLSMPRPKIAQLVEAAGGEVKKSVGKGLGYLVTNEDSGSSKAQAAKKLGTTIITENQLMDMLK